jgi:hypothetical protein
MGINPIVFGPYVWAAIHLICLGAPKTLDDDLKQKYKDFFMLLPAVLPCRKCGNHLAENLQQLPVYNSLNSADDLFAWSVNLHNLVNTQLGKPTLTEMDARKFWSSAPKCTITATAGQTSFKSDWTITYYILVIIIGIFIGYFANYLISKLRLKK